MKDINKDIFVCMLLNFTYVNGNTAATCDN